MKELSWDTAAAVSFSERSPQMVSSVYVPSWCSIRVEMLTTRPRTNGSAPATQIKNT